MGNLRVCYEKSPLLMGKLTIMVSIWLSAWWFYITILKNDGVRQWEGLYIPYMKWKIKAMFETTNQL